MYTNHQVILKHIQIFVADLPMLPGDHAIAKNNTGITHCYHGWIYATPKVYQRCVDAYSMTGCCEHLSAIAGVFTNNKIAVPSKRTAPSAPCNQQQP